MSLSAFFCKFLFFQKDVERSACDSLIPFSCAILTTFGGEGHVLESDSLESPNEALEFDNDEAGGRLRNE